MAYDTYMHLFFKKQPNGKLREIIVENNKSSVQVGEAKGKSGNCPFFTSGDAILEWDCSMVDGRNSFLNTGGNAAVKFYIGEAAYSTDTWCITANRNLLCFPLKNLVISGVSAYQILKPYVLSLVFSLTG